MIHTTISLLLFETAYPIGENTSPLKVGWAGQERSAGAIKREGIGNETKSGCCCCCCCCCCSDAKSVMLFFYGVLYEPKTYEEKCTKQIFS